MAGSLNHIVKEDGSFNMSLIENMRDAREALEECHQIIAALLPDGDEPSRMRELRAICERLNYPQPKHSPVVRAINKDSTDE